MSKLALGGRIVTMNAAFDVIAKGVLYIDGDSIAFVLPADAPVPAAFTGVAVIDTKATLFPGLIELHNHLAYNTIGLWQVASKSGQPFGDRDQWRGAKAYVDGLKRPAQVMAAHTNLLGAITRYVECKCLFGGVTTTQGIRLAKAGAISAYFKGLVRNVEQTLDPRLKPATTRINDVVARDLNAFRATLAHNSCCLLHLSEGTDDHAHQAFFALSTPQPAAIASSLAGIHCLRLEESDFNLLAKSGASMVWSPLSNLLLYADTSKVDKARDTGVTIGLGSDWTFSGSKNLLGELKVARAVNVLRKLGFADRDLVAMATSNAAKILRWDDHLGTLATGRIADVIAIDGTAGDPYDALLRASEHDVVLTVINGSPRYGTADLMTKAGANQGEVDDTTVAGVKRTLCFTSDPNTKQSVSFDDARDALTAALANLAKLEQDAKKPQPALSMLARRDAPQPMSLALDEMEDTGVTMRPNLPYRGALTGPLLNRATAATTKPPAPLQPQTLDPATFVDDDAYIEIISRQPNLKDDLKEALYAAYGRKPAPKPKGVVVTRSRFLPSS